MLTATRHVARRYSTGLGYSRTMVTAMSSQPIVAPATSPGSGSGTLVPIRSGDLYIPPSGSTAPAPTPTKIIDTVIGPTSATTTQPAPPPPTTPVDAAGSLAPPSYVPPPSSPPPPAVPQPPPPPASFPPPPMQDTATPATAVAPPQPQPASSGGYVYYPPQSGGSSTNVGPTSTGADATVMVPGMPGMALVKRWWPWAAAAVAIVGVSVLVRR